MTMQFRTFESDEPFEVEEMGYTSLWDTRFSRKESNNDYDADGIMGGDEGSYDDDGWG
ncbi:hypothetical protein [Glutamicibacter ardleyensis]|uniref:hypothetical protein n=1 Tax=Glutamicibacter ardleyensis TaxID=225894 RepID=UPI003FD4D8A2